jgi:hypothetical protein
MGIARLGTVFLPPTAAEAFMNAYAAAHRVKFGEDFSIVTSPSR